MRAELHLAEGELDALVDGELDGLEHARVESHVASCEGCQSELAELRWLRSELRSDGARAAARDPGLEARVHAALDHEDARGARAQLSVRMPARAWLRAGIAAVAGAAALSAWLAVPSDTELPSEVAARTLAAASAEPEAIDAATLEARFAAARLPFAARVLDLRMLGWQVASGGLAPVRGRASAQIAYRDFDGRSLLCLMIVAGVAELPEDSERFAEGGIAFFSFSRGEVTVVAWAEGDVLCLLAGALPASEVRALAVAKAMLPVSAPAPS